MERKTSAGDKRLFENTETITCRWLARVVSPGRAGKIIDLWRFATFCDTGVPAGSGRRLALRSKLENVAGRERASGESR